MLGLAHRGFSLHNYDDHLAAVLKSQGYRTALAGVEHEGVRRSAADIYDSDYLGGNAPEVAAAEFIRDASDRPFFQLGSSRRTVREEVSVPDPQMGWTKRP